MFWVIHLFTYLTKHFPSNPILNFFSNPSSFFFNGWEKPLTPSNNFSPQQKWCKKKEEVSCFQQNELFHYSYVCTFSYWLYPTSLLHFLWLYIIYHYIYSSFISPSLLYANLFLFSLQICSFVSLCTFLPLFFIIPVCFRVNIMRVHIWIFCLIFCFWFIFFHSLWTFTEFFSRGSK